jgi:hypothetical protein
MPTVRTVALFLALTVAGCGGPVYRFTSISAPQAPRPQDCAFAISTSPPDPRQFEEIGVLDARRQPSNRLDVFKRHAAPEICAAGGDLVVPEVNGYGYYMRGVLYRRVGGP